MGSETNRVRMTNDTNREIAQMNNEYNERQFDKQIQYNWDMWNAQNAYNTPTAQKQRLEDAGISPYAMLDGGSSGNAGGGQSVSPPQASSWQAQYASRSPFDEFLDNMTKSFSSIQSYNNSVNSEAEAALKSAQAEQIHIDNSTRRAQNIATINKLLGEKGLTDQQAANLKQANQFNEANNPVQLETNRQNLRFVSETAIGAALQNSLTSKQLQYFDKEKTAQIANTLAQTSELLARKQVDEATVKKIVQDTLESEARTVGIKLNNGVVADTYDAVVRSAKAQATQDEKSARDNPYSTNDSWLHGTYEVGQGIRNLVGGILAPFGRYNSSSRK